MQTIQRLKVALKVAIKSSRNEFIKCEKGFL